MTGEIKKEFGYSEELKFEDSQHSFPYDGLQTIEVTVEDSGVSITVRSYDQYHTIGMPDAVFNHVKNVVERGRAARLVASGNPAAVEPNRPTNTFKD